jgi:hypothetical protein
LWWGLGSMSLKTAFDLSAFIHGLLEFWPLTCFAFTASPPAQDRRFPIQMPGVIPQPLEFDQLGVTVGVAEMQGAGRPLSRRQPARGAGRGWRRRCHAGRSCGGPGRCSARRTAVRCRGPSERAHVLPQALAPQLSRSIPATGVDWGQLLCNTGQRDMGLKILARSWEGYRTLGQIEKAQQTQALIDRISKP